MTPIQKAVPQASGPSCTDRVKSSLPKLKPKSVTECASVDGVLRGIPCECTGASKLKTGCDVPATPPTVTAEYPNTSGNAVLRHDTDVDEDQEDVLQRPISIPLDIV